MFARALDEDRVEGRAQIITSGDRVQSLVAPLAAGKSLVANQLHEPHELLVGTHGEK